MSKGVTYYDPPAARVHSSLYSHVARVQPGELAFIAGQVSAKAGRREGEFALQFQEVLDAIGAILGDLGADFDSVVKFTTYLVDADHIAPFRELRNTLFPTLFAGPLYPPNTLLVVERLGNPEWLIEVETVARLPEPD